MQIYLDSSALVKRYVSEKGSELLDKLYEKADTGELLLATSIWNLGEALGVLDMYKRRGWIDEKQFQTATSNLAGETIRLTRLKVMRIIAMTSSIVANSWQYILSYSIYEADAIQLTSFAVSNSNLLLSADTVLIRAAVKEGIKAFNVEKEESKRILTS